MRVCSFFASRLLYSALRSRRGQAAPTGQGLAARTEAWRLPAGGALLKTPNLIGLMAHSSARSTAWKSRIYLSRSQFHLCLALQPQLPQFSRTGEKLLLRCVIFCSCLWSVSFSFLAGFEKPLGALVLCIVLFKHTHQTPESQQSSQISEQDDGVSYVRDRADEAPPQGSSLASAVREMMALWT